MLLATLRRDASSNVRTFALRLILLTTAAVLALCSAASANADPSGAKPDFPATQNSIRIATDNSGNAPGGTGVEESTQSKGATNKQGKAGMMPAGSATMNGANSSDQGGTGVKASAQGGGATNKSTEDRGAPVGSHNGASAGNAPGGTGAETSSQGEVARIRRPIAATPAFSRCFDEFRAKLRIVSYLY